MHLHFSTSRATLQALHPSDKSGLTGPSAEDLQPAEEKISKTFLTFIFSRVLLSVLMQIL